MKITWVTQTWIRCLTLLRALQLLGSAARVSTLWRVAVGLFAALCAAWALVGTGHDMGPLADGQPLGGGGFTDMHWVRGREKARERGRKGEGEGERVREREVLWNHWHAIYLPILSLCATLI